MAIWMLGMTKLNVD